MKVCLENPYNYNIKNKITIKTKIVGWFIFDLLCIFRAFEWADSYAEFFSDEGHLPGSPKQETLPDA